jgi:hypothetical protein
VENYLEVLRKQFMECEFEECEDAFLSKLRPNMNWDKDSFLELVTAMNVCCENYQSKDMVEKWVANGFWYIPQFIHDWTTHPNFPKSHSSEYYEKAYSLLNDLAFYFFIGAHPRADNRNLIKVFLEETR